MDTATINSVIADGFPDLIGNALTTAPETWAGLGGRYAYDTPAEPRPRELEGLRLRVQAVGFWACDPHRPLAEERALRLQAAAWADSRALEAERSGNGGAEAARQEAEAQAFLLRDFDAYHSTRQGNLGPHDEYFEDDEDGPELSREYIRQEWAARAGARPIPLLPPW